jgi:endonuclease YncB( thermonuclease family)
MNEYPLQVIRVVDGDTIVADVALGFGVTFSGCYLRLLGINAPERGTSGATEATQYIVGRLANAKKTTCKSSRKDKYGRHVADVFVDGESISEALLKAGLVEVYK